MINFDENQTCDTVKSLNSSVVFQLDEGWASIPESLLFDLLIALILISPYVFLPKIIHPVELARKYRWLSWMKFFHGTLFKLPQLKSPSLNKDDIKLIEKYLDLQQRQQKQQQNNPNNSNNNAIFNENFRMINNNKKEFFLELLPQHFELKQQQQEYDYILDHYPSLPTSVQDVIFSGAYCPSAALTGSSSSSSTTSLATGGGNPQETSGTKDGTTTTATTTTTTTTPISNNQQSSSIDGKDHPNNNRSSSSFNDDLKTFWNSLKSMYYKISSLEITDEQIFLHKGHDAYQYLLFQRYLIIILSIMSFIAIFFILPVNFHSNPHCIGFACTSFNNLPFRSGLCWFHITGATIIIIITVILMNQFAHEINLEEEENFQHRRILLMYLMDNDDDNDTTDNTNNNNNQTQLQQQQNQRKSMKELYRCFDRRFPSVRLIGIQVIQDIRRLQLLQPKYRTIIESLNYCQSLGYKTSFRDYRCNPLCNCCPPNSLCPQSIDTIDYYTQKKLILQQEIDQEFESILKQPIKAFLAEFETEQMAYSVYNTIRKSYRNSFGTSLDKNNIQFISDKLYYAPEPDDINWSNLTFDINFIWPYKILCSILLLLLFFFLSTPSYLMSLLYLVAFKKLEEEGLIVSGSALMNYLSPLLLVLLVSLMPELVTQVLSIIPYITISELNHAVMTNLYFFVVLTVIILPSAGFTTMNGMLESFIGVNNRSEQAHFRWQCLFPVDNGAFFVIYVIHSAILSNIMEMLHVGDIFIYFFKYLFCIHTEYEYKSARRSIISCFPLSISYSQFLLIFTMTLIFGFASPLIVPFGLIYMIGKHMVDRYNIYNAYIPAKINPHIHTTAIKFVYIALNLMMIQLFGAILIKSNSVATKAVFILFLITLALSFTQCFCFRLLGQKKTKSALKNRVSDICICGYTWPIFSELLNDGFFGEYPTGTVTLKKRKQQQQQQKQQVEVIKQQPPPEMAKQQQLSPQQQSEQQQQANNNNPPSSTLSTTSINPLHFSSCTSVSGATTTNATNNNPNPNTSPNLNPNNTNDYDGKLEKVSEPQPQPVQEQQEKEKSQRKQEIGLPKQQQEIPLKPEDQIQKSDAIRRVLSFEKSTNNKENNKENEKQ